MPIAPGASIELDIEKAVAGGRMLARHEGQIVLVWGAIPGERVRARVDRVSKGVVYATTADVLRPSSDRRPVNGDWRCGGNVYAHIDYARQLHLKGEVVADALSRIGRMPAPAVPVVAGSPETGYRMRARLHVRDGHVGFFREETHDICAVRPTGQLLPETAAWIDSLHGRLQSRQIRDVTSVEIAENVPGTERVAYLELRSEPDTRALRDLFEEGGLTGLTCALIANDGRATHASPLLGLSTVTDVVHVSEDSPPKAVRLRRDVRAFFQGNRYLLEPFVRHVLKHVPAGPVVDLYAGVGLLGLSLAAAGSEHVTVVEGDPVSAADLQGNAESFAGSVTVRPVSVESFVRNAPPLGEATIVVDPPRTGMSHEVVAGLIARRPPRVVFVSCDPATLARDVRLFAEAGYELEQLGGFDLFPNTSHIECVGVLTTTGRL